VILVSANPGTCARRLWRLAISLASGTEGLTISPVSLSLGWNSAKIRFTSVTEIGISGADCFTKSTASLMAAERFSPRSRALLYALRTMRERANCHGSFTPSFRGRPLFFFGVSIGFCLPFSAPGVAFCSGSGIASAFDWLVLDSPPPLPVHDASSLADLCDGVLFVVRAGETDHEAAEKASLEFREKNLLSVVLNQVEKSEGQGGYYYGHVDKT
jgi:hypothetical protein